jgi:hypothetical protein
MKEKNSCRLASGRGSLRRCSHRSQITASYFQKPKKKKQFGDRMQEHREQVLLQIEQKKQGSSCHLFKLKNMEAAALKICTVPT